MLGFKGNVTITRISAKDYRLEGDLSYTNNEVMVIAKSGLVFDGASIPRLFWRWVGSPFTGNYVEAACIHDALYVSELIPRKQADELFLEMMEYSNVSWWKRNAMYYAVRMGGGFVWKKHTPESVKEGRQYCEVISLIDGSPFI